MVIYVAQLQMECIVVFLWQHWLREHATVIPYMHSTYFVYVCMHTGVHALCHAQAAVFLVKASNICFPADYSWLYCKGIILSDSSDWSEGNIFDYDTYKNNLSVEVFEP
jgi:hypothetical protein